MKKIITLALVLMASLVFAASPLPRSSGYLPMLLNASAATSTSPAFEVVPADNPKSVVVFRFQHEDDPIGVVEIQTTPGPLAAVKNGSAVWTTVLTVAKFEGQPRLAPAPAFFRAKFTRTSGALDVLVRGHVVSIQEVK